MFYRNCPQCSIKLEYTDKYNRNSAEKQKKLCKSCSLRNSYGLNKLERFELIDDKKIYVRDCPSCGNAIKTKDRRKYLNAVRQRILCRSCNSFNRYGLNKLPNVEFINGNRMFFRLCPSCNEKVYNKSMAHIRLSIKRKTTCVSCTMAKTKFIFPNYNPTACKLIDEYGAQNGYNFQHAENGGEFLVPTTRYFVDGYDKQKNVVIEIDESHHKYQLEKDVEREQTIKSILGCKFIRLPINEYYPSS